MITPEREVNTEVLIDGSSPDFDAEDLKCRCPVCRSTLGVPYVWIVFEQETDPVDFFVHPHCVARLKTGQFFRQK